jgi:S1/P1 Nuclease
MKPIPQFFLLGLLLASSIPTAFGYGNAGHEAVGNVAAHYLAGTRAETEVRKLLRPNEDLAKAATWADRAKLPEQYLSDEMKDFVAHNPEHHSYHFCDVPFQEKAYQEGGTGTGPNDIVHTMRLCIAILRDPKSHADNPRNITPRIALLLLAHFAGDIHQPLHVGTSYVNKKNQFVDPDKGRKGQEDAGANYFKLNKSTSLHGYWDTIAVKKVRDKAAGQDFTTWLIEQHPPKPDWKTNGAVSTWPRKWATDTLQLSAQCYKDIKISDRETIPATDTHPAHDEWKATLPPGYDERAAGIVEVELTKAGYRLAELLKAIWP